MLRSLVAAVTLGAVLGGGPAVSAMEARFEMDAAQDVAELARTRRVAISVDRLGNVYTLDASAVVHADARALLDASLDYEGYVRMGVPHVRESRIVSMTPGADSLHTWTSMSGLGLSSKHYLEVRIARHLHRAGAAGVRWELAARQPAWPYEEARAFTRLQGSWYLEPLSPHAVYVRYFAVVALESSLPGEMVAWIVKGQLRQGTGALVRALSQEAGRRPGAATIMGTPRLAPVEGTSHHAP